MSLEVLIEDFRADRAVLGFSGWPDVGLTVQHTVAHLKESLLCKDVAVWDIDGFWHTGSVRPQVTVHQGTIQRLEWPTWHFSLCGQPLSESVLVGFGPEPECGWRRFTAEILHFLKDRGCREIILLGSLLDEVLYDEALISCVVQDILGFNRVRELRCRMADYEGSSAIHSAIMESAKSLDIHCMSFWAHLPFYLTTPHELSIARLLEILGTLLGFEFDTGALLEEWERRVREIEDNLNSDQELLQLLESLKKQGRASRPFPSTSKVLRLDEFLQKKSRPPSEEE